MKKIEIYAVCEDYVRCMYLLYTAFLSFLENILLSFFKHIIVINNSPVMVSFFTIRISTVIIGFG